MDYFANAPVKLHSEMGSPDVPSMDSLHAMMPRSALWPPSSMWPLHDFDLHFVSDVFGEAVDRGYGGAGKLEDWAILAQFVEYDAYRGMFEGQSKDRMGLLIWMSHSAWPSLLCRPTTTISIRRLDTSAPRRPASRCTYSGTR